MTPVETALFVFGIIATVVFGVMGIARMLYSIGQRDELRQELHAALRTGDVKHVRALMVVHRRAFTREMQGEVEVWLSDREDSP